MPSLSLILPPVGWLPALGLAVWSAAGVLWWLGRTRDSATGLRPDAYARRAARSALRRGGVESASVVTLGNHGSIKRLHGREAADAVLRASVRRLEQAYAGRVLIVRLESARLLVLVRAWSPIVMGHEVAGLLDAPIHWGNESLCVRPEVQVAVVTHETRSVEAVVMDAGTGTKHYASPAWGGPSLGLRLVNARRT